MYAAPLQLSPPQQMGMQDSAQDTGSMGSAGTTAVPASNDLQSTVGVWFPHIVNGPTPAEHDHLITGCKLW